MKLSVIIPTFNRPERLAHTLRHLRAQMLPPAEYELIVVDDGSTPPLVLPPTNGDPACTLLRFDEILERCVARNRGAEIARGEVLVFLDDDLEVGPDFLEAHLRAQAEWPGALVGGNVVLPREALSHPFVRFRQGMEASQMPPARGPTTTNAVGAGNFSMSRAQYLRLGGFDTGMVGIEDQDFGYRHLATGGTVVYLPEAVAVHWDHALTIRPYCLRTEFAAESVVPLVRRYPDWPANRHRHEVNGPTRWGREPLRRSLTKALKRCLALPPALEVLFGLTWLLERMVPWSRTLDRMYRLLMGIHLQKGYRKSLRRPGGLVPAGGPAKPPLFSPQATP